MGTFDRFREAMTSPGAPSAPAEITRLLDACVMEACGELGLVEAEIYSGGQIVTMLLTAKHAWEAVIIGPDAYQLYPGFIRDDGETIVWANVWIADNYSLQKFVSVLEQEFERAAKGEDI